MTSTKLKPLGEIATLQRGFDLPHQDRQEGQIPIISSGGRSGFHSVHKVNPPGVVTGRYGSIGEFFYIEEKFWPLNTTLWVKNFHGNCEKYVYYLLSSLNFDKFSAKTGVPGVNRNDLHKIKVPFLPIQKQKTVVQTLECWDNAIEKTEALIAAKEKQFEWLMEKLFKPNDTWTPYRLGELFDNRKETHNTDLPLVSITREKGVIPHSETNRKDNSSEDKSKYLRIRPDDIGYNTMRMWQGVSALSGIDGIVSPAYTICIPKKIVDPEFMAFLFKTKPMIHKFYRYSQGLTSDTWNLKFHHFCEVKAEIPDIKTQIEIAQILNTAKQEINLLKKTLEQYRTQKRGLMQKLLTGEWQVSNAQIGAESELQERTKENIA